MENSSSRGQLKAISLIVCRVSVITFYKNLSNKREQRKVRENDIRVHEIKMRRKIK
jgi:hypothetical protein